MTSPRNTGERSSTLTTWCLSTTEPHRSEGRQLVRQKCLQSRRRHAGAEERHRDVVLGTEPLDQVGVGEIAPGAVRPAAGVQIRPDLSEERLRRFVVVVPETNLCQI